MTSNPDDSLSKLDDFEDLFEQAQEENDTEKPYDYAERTLEKIEAEFRQLPSEHREREDEKQKLSKKMGELKKKLHKSRNVRNPRKTQLNQELAAKRKQYRAEMERVKDRLYQIDLEEKGAGVTSKNLVDTTIGQQ